MIKRVSKIKNTILTFALFLMSTISVCAQNQHCNVKGYIVDETKTPVGFASVAIASDSTFISGTLTNENGEFVLQLAKTEKPYQLSVSFIGKKTKQISFVANAKNITLDTITLENNAYQLEEVQISAEQTPQNAVEHKVISPQSVMSEVKGSVLDVLKAVPSISVDNEDNVSIRGNSNVLVLVNGLPTAMTSLSAIPSANIANVEVITSPDSRYDSEGTGGIINIVLKENKNEGWSGMFAANYGFNHFTNANAAVNYVKNGNSFRFNYNLKYEDDIIDGNLTRKFVDSGNWLEQQFHSARTIFNNNIGVGTTLRLNKKNKLSIDARFIMPRLNTQQQFANTYGTNGLQYDEIRNSNVSWNRENIDGSISYTHIINPQSADMTIKASVSKIWGHRPSYYFLENDSIGKSNSGGSPLNTSAQCDFKVIREYGRWDAGFKFSYRQNDIYHEFYNMENSQWTYSNEYSNDLLHREFIPAIYMLFSSDANKKFTWKAGIRTEYSGVILQNDKDAMDTTTHHFFVGPSLMLNYKIKSKKEELKQHISLAFNSRIGRPAYPQLNPYMSMIDAHTFEQGNPKLIPETSYHLEFSYGVKDKITKFTTNIYADYLKDNITQVAMLKNDILLLTFVNGNFEFKTGLDASLDVTPCKWVDIQLGTNTYYVDTKGDYDGVDLDNRGIVNSDNLKIAFHPIKMMDIQLQYFFETPQYYPQFTTKLSHHLDIGISQKFLKGSLAVSLLLTDVFKTNIWNIFSDNRVYHLTNTSINKSRMLWIGVRYNFNSYKANNAMKNAETDRNKVRLGL